MSGRRKARISRSDAEWRASLTADQYRVTRTGVTEPPFTGPYWDEFGAGKYRCVCCGQELFLSRAKFDSGCGWPSFFQTIADDVVTAHTDRSQPIERSEIRCACCAAHLGHVFADGPLPTGLRYCMNGTALDFERDADEEPAG